MRRTPSKASPRKPTGLAALAWEDSLDLGAQLRRHVRSAGSRARWVSLALGHGPTYLSRAFLGRNLLRLRDVFGIFEVLGEDPRGFFQFHYAPPSAASANALLSSQPTPSGLTLERLAGRLLLGRFARRGRRVKPVSLALGYPGDGLASHLRGAQPLYTWQAFGVLRALEESPGTFFDDLLLPDIASAERSLLGLVEELLRQRAASRTAAREPDSQ